MSLSDRLRRLESQHDPDGPREFEVWIDEPGGLVRNHRTGERMTVAAFQRRHGDVRQVTLALGHDHTQERDTP